MVKRLFLKEILQEKAKGQAAYNQGIRFATRGLWNGSSDAFDFTDSMVSVINLGYTSAWNEGAASCGIKPSERTDEENDTLQSRINEAVSFLPGYTDFIIENSRANGGLLRAVLERASLWQNRFDEILSQAKTMACDNTKFVWRVGPTDHCFPAGTTVHCIDGYKNIEDINIGDLVHTTDGPKPVTKLFKKHYEGDMVEVVSGKNKVTSTSNHPFLTKRGWVRADNLTLDDIVFTENISNNFFTHRMLPNSFNNITAGCKIFILSFISFLLSFLSIGQWFKSRMTMPVFAIGLYNKIINFAINNKFLFDDKKRMIFNSDMLKYLKHFKLKFSWFIFLVFGFAQCKFLHKCFSFIRIVYIKLLNFFDTFRIVHRVIFEHMGFSFRVYNSMRCFFVQSQFKRTGFHQNLFMRKVKLFSNSFSSVCRVVFFKIVNLVFIPYTFSIKMLIAIRLFSSPLIIANGASLQVKLFSFSGSDFAFTNTSISTQNRTVLKSIWTRWINKFFKIVVTNFTNKFSRFFSFLSGHKISPCSVQNLTTLYHNSLYVYNLEVEQAHNYEANGFVVHNCNTCLRLNGRVMRASRWKDLDVWPRDTRPGKLKCHGYRCQCELNETPLPATPGRLPRLG